MWGASGVPDLVIHHPSYMRRIRPRFAPFLFSFSYIEHPIMTAIHAEGSKVLYNENVYHDSGLLGELPGRNRRRRSLTYGFNIHLFVSRQTELALPKLQNRLPRINLV